MRIIFEGLTGSMSGLRWVQGTEDRSREASRGVAENRLGGSWERRLQVDSERAVRDGVDNRLSGDTEDRSGMLFSDNTWKIGNSANKEKLIWS